MSKDPVRAKKHLGQHFLKDLNIAQKIVNQLPENDVHPVLEIGPGTGVLTQYLAARKDRRLVLMDVDQESVAFLKEQEAYKEVEIYYQDFLEADLQSFMKEDPFYVIGNFPYNISSQIFFKILEHKNQIPIVVGMIQKEVAQRLASPPGSKVYGILSVLLQAYYTIHYSFSVPPQVFSPPPKVQSAVIVLKRNERETLGCNERKFFQIVKAGFNQRRKTLRNGLKSFVFKEEHLNNPYFDMRAEQLSVNDYINLTNMLV